MSKSVANAALRRDWLAGARSRGLCALLLCCACWHAGVGRVAADARGAQSTEAYLERLLARARGLHLGTDPAWLRLGHYRTTAFGEAPVSEVDGPNFFLSPRGKVDPEAELEATLRAFFTPHSGRAEPAICHYPARFAFLHERLAFELARLSLPACEKFLTFVKEANPRAVTLVFSSYYLNNPASAFGHTFLRLDKADNFAVGEKRELLDYAIDYSADVDTGNAIIYALKGLFGGFPGTVKRMPNYYKVREYNDYESRDMWEYELQLSPKERYMLLAHIWEIGHSYFDYFYLGENCSYRILLMLEAAKPGVDLVDGLGSPVLPADTIKALFRNPGLVARVSYRPSLRTRFEHDVQGLSAEQRERVDALADQPDLPLPASWSVAEQVQVLDSAADLVDIRSIKELVQHTDLDAAERKRRLLERRSQIHVPSPVPPLQPPWDKAPERAHGTKRLGLGPGVRDADGQAGFLTLDFRLAMHDLADPADGYPELSQIEFLPTRLRVFPKRSGPHFALDDFSLVQIVSLNALSRFDLHPSWRFSFGARTLEGNGCDECLAGKIRFGAGPTVSFADDAVTLFLLGDGLVHASGALSGIADGPIRGGLGPAGGVRLRLDPNLLWLTQAEWVFYPAQRDPRVWQLDSVVRWSFVREVALSLELRALRDRREAMLLVLSYF